MQISKSVQYESCSSRKNESNRSGIETIGVRLKFLGPKQETFPYRKYLKYAIPKLFESRNFQIFETLFQLISKIILQHSDTYLSQIVPFRD